MGSAVVQTIGIAFNLKRPSDDDTYEEYDEIETIQALRKEIKRYGFKTVLLEQDDAFLRTISTAKVDFVVNIAEGKGATRARESQVPCVLESLGIPYSGSDPIALGITLDKYLTSRLLQAAGVPVPRIYMIRSLNEVEQLHGIFKGEKRFIVKPRWEGSSRGIFLNSVVAGTTDLRKRARRILSVYRQPALAEEFLTGDEITVGVYGNKAPRVLGMMRIRHRDPSEKYFIYSLENKKDWETKIVYEGQASIPRRIRDQVARYAVQAFQALELRDLARIDFRTGGNGIPGIIDINPLPGLSPRYSDLPILCRLNGGTYSGLIKILLRESLKRYGLKLRDWGIEELGN